MRQSAHAHSVDGENSIAFLQTTILGSWRVAQDLVNLLGYRRPLITGTQPLNMITNRDFLSLVIGTAGQGDADAAFGIIPLQDNDERLGSLQRRIGLLDDLLDILGGDQALVAAQRREAAEFGGRLLGGAHILGG